MTPEHEVEGWYRAHYWAVTRYVARRLTDQPEDVRDVVAEVFATAWRRRSAVPPEVLPWLYGVAANVLANERRRRARSTRLAERLAREPAGPEQPPELPDAVDRAMAQLSDADREVLRLAAWEQLTTDELALALRCSRSAAAMRLSRARTRLRERLAASPTTASLRGTP
ncbi:RNA polymerase sigma factor [Blastococcus sp. TF02A-26]|uniref:RNA polymerase sigma factor n=1 Tax=Blastococcus sp. TF02A-26 TaxID=2250577 RepID=UPI000DE80ED9|nr:sigma-70 family RNA polymerase sigma factor [Blastococcus sp. TF02A-26]RBY86823.1 sigma-70 family RNA polymerase sigma factor [Blastococcus sp. TF02A-26]